MNNSCVQCGDAYKVTEDDLALLKKLSPIIQEVRYDLPTPQCCHDCRSQRRMAIRNESKLYSRPCDLTGEECISLYSQDSPYTVYKDDAWWSDSWDPLDYGREIDFSRPFFEQLNELRLAVPRKAMQQDGIVENCQYTTYTSGSKNCYMLFSSGYCEDVYYSAWMVMATSCVDCYACISSELLYECVDSVNCYNSFYLQDCHGCQDSYFLENCRNVHHSIACKNLRSKGYHIFNQPVSKEEFEELRKELHNGGFSFMKRKFVDWGYTVPTLYAQLQTSENCTGNMLEHANNCHNCFGVMLGAQDLRHCQWCGWKGKDMMDCLGSGKDSELIYEATASVVSQRIYFASSIDTSSNCLYSDCIKQCHNIFGCVGLSYRRYCILNKQYCKVEYEDLVPKIIQHMKATGEWGENIPVAISPFAYNETIAQEYFPLSKEEALVKGFRWKDEIIDMPDVEKIIPAEKLPINIDDIPDDVLNWAIECQETKKPYLISAQELLFYRKMNIPVPRLHPEERHIARQRSRLPAKLWERQCSSCDNTFQTPYAPDSPHRVYCEPCFLDEIYNSHDKNNIAGDDSHLLNQKMINQARSSYRKFKTTARTAKKILTNKIKQ